MTFISARPMGHFKNFNSRQKCKVPNVRFFPRGRDALTYGVSSRVPKHKTVLFPAYFCDPSAACLRTAGFDVQWMDVSHDLSFNSDRLSARLTSGSISAVVICDFFGWTSRQLQPISNLVKEHRALLIRDCCHSPLSWRADQIQSDMTIFSIRKVLPVWDGGALLGCGVLATSTENGPHFLREIRRETVRVCEKALSYFDINPYSILDLLRSFIGSTPATSGAIYGEVQPSRQLLQWLCRTGSLHEIARIRRKNFVFLQEALSPSGLGSLFPILGEHDVPQVLPLKTSGAGSLVKFLRSRGIGAVQWPGIELPAEVAKNPLSFPVAIEMNGTIACLPLHQDLGKFELERIAVSVNEWKSAGGK